VEIANVLIFVFYIWVPSERAAESELQKSHRPEASLAPRGKPRLLDKEHKSEYLLTAEKESRHSGGSTQKTGNQKLQSVQTNDSKVELP